MQCSYPPFSCVATAVLHKAGIVAGTVKILQGGCVAHAVYKYKSCRYRPNQLFTIQASVAAAYDTAALVAPVSKAAEAPSATWLHVIASDTGARPDSNSSTGGAQ